MIDAPLGLAFAAGLVATVNPCGFAMLPAYLSYFVGIDGADQAAAEGDPENAVSRRSGVASALRVSGIVSAGFLVVFGVTGLLVNAGVRAVIDIIPYLALGVGITMIGLGIAVFRGLELSIGFLKVGRGASSRDTKSIFGFGVSYAVASLSCTLPVFLSVVVGSLAASSFTEGLATYLAYGLGMSVVIVALTVAVALAERGLVNRVRSLLPYVQRVSAVFLVIAGIYITWFWIDDLSSDAGDQGAAAGVVDQWSASITNWVSDNSQATGLFLGGIVLIAIISTVLKRFEPEVPITTDGAADSGILEEIS